MYHDYNNKSGKMYNESNIRQVPKHIVLSRIDIFLSNTGVTIIVIIIEISIKLIISL